MRASRNDLTELLRCSLDNPLDHPFADVVAVISPKGKIFIEELVEELAELFPMFTRSQIEKLCRLRPASRKELLHARLFRPERFNLSQPVGYRQLSELRKHFATKAGSSKRPRGQVRLKRGKLATLLGCSQHSICDGYVDLFSSVKREAASKSHQELGENSIQKESKGRNNGATGSGVNGTNQVSIGLVTNFVAREAVSSKSLRLVQILDETLFPAVAGTEPRASRRDRIKRWVEALIRCQLSSPDALFAALKRADPAIAKGMDGPRVMARIKSWCEDPS